MVSKLKVLVSGASGFIGSKLAEKLSENEHSVTGIFHKNEISIPKVKLIQGDLTDPKFTVSNETFDVVFHLAAETPLEKNKKKCSETNYEGTVNFFNQIKDKTKFLVYVSGLGVFGDAGDRIVDEHTPIKPHTDYSKVRLKAQKFLDSKCKENSISFTVTFLGEVYGNGGWFTSQIIPRLKKGTFKLPSGGEYFRCVVHVDDVVSALVAIAKKNAVNETFIITDSNPVLFKDFINFTADQLGVKHPGKIPTFLAKAILGGDSVKLLTTPIKVSNEKISKICDFKYPSFKEGIKSVISEIK